MEAVKAQLILRNLGFAIAIWAVLTVPEIGERWPEDHMIGWLNFLCGISFIGLCASAMLKRPAQANRVLAVVGFGCSLIFLSGPVFESQNLASFFSILRSGLVLAGFAAMLHFLLLFPAAGTFVAHQRNVRVLYLPAFLFWLLLSYRVLFPDTGGAALDTFTYFLTGLIMAGYLLTGVIVFLRRFIKTPKALRKPLGLRLMLLGSLAGFIPAAVAYMPALSSVRGHEYIFVSLIILPLVWTRAAAMAQANSGKFKQL
jgi:hypothetical protein